MVAETISLAEPTMGTIIKTNAPVNQKRLYKQKIDAMQWLLGIVARGIWWYTHLSIHILPWPPGEDDKWNRGA